MLMLLTPGIAQINTPSGATIPFNGNGNYQYGIMPSNLPSGGTYGKSQAAADAYNSWKQDFVEDCSVGKRVKYDDRSQTVSEGIGYGMLLAAYAADKDLFDGLWQYYKNNSNGNGLMNWKISGCSGTAGSGGATDADLDAAMALVVAACQWPSATNPYNYKNEATALITAIKDHEIHYSSYQAINGDGWGFGSDCRNPSYQSPAYYKAFGDFVPSQADFWNNAVNASYTLINANANGTTGLVSNWSNPGGQANNCNGGSVEYGYDACRNPWRMGVDAIWNNDSKATALCNKIAGYVQGKGAGSVGGSIPQSGGSGTHNSTFVSTFSAAICGAGASYQTLMNAMYTENVSTKDNTYFGMTLRTIMLFMETGNFWKPCSSVTDVSVSLSTSPASNTVFTEGDAITLNATASTSNGTITKVEFYDGNSLLTTDNSSPYSFSISSLSSGNHDLKAVATSSSGQTGTFAVSISVNKAVFKTSTPPSIDGVADASWANFAPTDIAKVILGSVGSSSDLSAQWRANWDNSNLYVLVEVTDDAKKNDSNTEIYNDDAIEVYIDINNDKATSYGANDFQYTFRWNDATVYEKNDKTTNVVFEQTTTSTGYIIEAKIPWATLSGSPATGQLVGFDVLVNDDDDGGERDDKISWTASADDAWENPSLLGTVVLEGTTCTLPGAATGISGSNTACAGMSTTYTTNTVSGATSYTWTAPSGSTITSGQGSTSISVQWGSASGNVTVTPTNACGSGTASSLSVAIGGASVPAVTISGASSICVGDAATFSATPSNGGSSPSFQWKINGNAISGATSSTYSTAGLLDNDILTVEMTSNATCLSSPTVTSDPLTISIDQKPTQADAGSDQNISSSSATFEGNEPLVGVGTWTKVNGAGIIANADNYNSIVSGLQTGVNTFTWTIANGACPSSSDNVIINVGEDIPVISKTSVAPTIDGLVDASWDSYIPTAITKVIQGSVGSSSDLSAQWRALWDNSNLYVLIEVTDNTQENDSPETYNDDAVEIYIDINNDKATSYGANDFQYVFRWDDVGIYETTGKSTDDIVLEQTTTSTGYIIEAKIPWATLSGSPAIGQSLGFDVHVNDDDDGGVRDAKISWAANTDDAWQNPSLFGTAILEGESTITSTYSKVVSSYKAAPNPFNEKTYITVNKALRGNITARVTDARGVVVQEITGIQSGEQIELGSNLESGVYLVQLISTEGVEILRVIKSK